MVAPRRLWQMSRPPAVEIWYCSLHTPTGRQGSQCWNNIHNVQLLDYLPFQTHNNSHMCESIHVICGWIKKLVKYYNKARQCSAMQLYHTDLKSWWPIIYILYPNFKDTILYLVYRLDNTLNKTNTLEMSQFYVIDRSSHHTIPCIGIYVDPWQIQNFCQ